MDQEQFADSHEYYTLLAKANATMAGMYQAGKFGDANQLAQFFPDTSGGIPQPLADAEFKAKMRMGEEFLRNAKNLFPPNLVTEQRISQWKRIMVIANVYRPELNGIATMNKDYWAMCHGNFNVDNTWWWRDDSKKTVCGRPGLGRLEQGQLATEVVVVAVCIGVRLPQGAP